MTAATTEAERHPARDRLWRWVNNQPVTEAWLTEFEVRLADVEAEARADAEAHIERLSLRAARLDNAWAAKYRQARASLDVDVLDRITGDYMVALLGSSDGGNNPFYADDDDTVALGEHLAQGVRAILAEKQP